ncbi:chromate efflux transporter [Flavobacterium sp. HSC-61S13]|uniref:chromate efflux transporter n=1 Tax=Flavobacterium sp. HSC-61S13 TaxID=2910963 RepID=UPI00209ECFA6|nr:chromate efflux transporter [Flavobacterium sp. HSC-61S13]MCP1994336.1 chromate transporter [Flavobacterium sp. HSC-61S13]
MEQNNIPIKEIAKLFIKLGCIGFGGPAAHIAMMQQEVVVKRKWMNEQHFLDLLGATNLIPGPNSTEMAIHIGYDKGGWKGLIVAGICFILPAVFITIILAWLYGKYGQLPEMEPFIYGIKPAIIAVIIGAVYPLAKKSIKSTYLASIGIAVLVLSLFNINEIYLMFGAGFLTLGLYYIKHRKINTIQSITPLLFLQITHSSILWETNIRLFWIFLKIGAILYGSGYVLFAFLDTELVTAGLLTRQQLVDSIAVGQFTPGPVFSSVTFIGYQINGFSGAIISTIAIFLPSFFLVALLNPLIKILRKSKGFSVFLDAVNVASVAIIIAICFNMSKEVITNWRGISIAIVSAFVVIKFRQVNSAFIVIGAVIMGYILSIT